MNEKNIYFVLEIFEKMRLEDILICMDIQAHRLKVINPCQAEKIPTHNMYIYVIRAERVNLASFDSLEAADSCLTEVKIVAKPGN